MEEKSPRLQNAKWILAKRWVSRTS